MLTDTDFFGHHLVVEEVVFLHQDLVVQPDSHPVPLLRAQEDIGPDDKCWIGNISNRNTYHQANGLPLF